MTTHELFSRALTLSLFIAIAALSACTQDVAVAPPGGSSAGADAPAAFTRFPDMPIPTRSDFDMDRSMVFGGNDAWFGRLVIKTFHNTNAMFDFYKEQLAAFGWQEITSLRSAVSVLTYSRQDRIATIQIQGRTLPGSEIIITVSPRGAPQALPAAPAPAPAMPAPVQRVR